MTRVCCYCKRVMGEKNPEQPGVTHGCCPECGEKEMAALGKSREKNEMEPNPMKVLEEAREKARAFIQAEALRAVKLLEASGFPKVTIHNNHWALGKEPTHPISLDVFLEP